MPAHSSSIATLEIPELGRAVPSFPPIDSQKALARKVAFLRRRKSYPHRPERVETVQTHMSWVFLAGARAFKLKKPVRNEVLDFASLEARRLSCVREIRLNRRLAPGVYLDILPLTSSPGGRLHLGAGGEIVEWLVEMQRLPREKSLARRIRDRNLDPAHLDGLGAELVAFYQGSGASPLRPDLYRRRFEEEIRASTEVLAASAGQLPRDVVLALASAQLRFLSRHSRMVEDRAELVIEAHGDLRPEHVFLLEPRPVVIDSLEFDRRLRLLDPADELSYLALESSRLGADWVGSALFDIYTGETGDLPPARLLGFYRCHRAFVRAKIAYWHLRDVTGHKADRWLARARSYLTLAAHEMVSAR
jgi:uncharacterized protein